MGPRLGPGRVVQTLFLRQRESMQSSTLEGAGLLEWRRFAVDFTGPHARPYGAFLVHTPASASVFALRARRQIGRFAGSSDVVYIGCARDLRARLRSYVDWHDSDPRFTDHSTPEARVAAAMLDEPLDVAWLVMLTFASARQLEDELLQRCREAAH